MSLLIGLLGMVFILFAWIYETLQSIRKHKIFIDLKFASLYLIAIIFLLIYSYQINDIVFIWLNIILLVFIAAEIFYTLFIKKFRK